MSFDRYNVLLQEKFSYPEFLRESATERLRKMYEKQKRAEAREAQNIQIEVQKWTN